MAVKTWLREHKIKVLIGSVLLILAMICLCLSVFISNALDYLNAGKRWAGESGERFEYISTYLPENLALNENAIYSTCQSIENKLSEASIQGEEGRKVWNYAYCGNGFVTVSTERGSATVNALGVGGEFFFFHPMNLVSGSYISESDLMHDRCVLDRELAWKLFGAIDVSGMELTLGDKTLIVAGVVEREKDFASREALTDESGIYLCFDVFSEATGKNAECFEAVLPNPVKNFAKGLVKEVFGTENTVIIENSARYGISAVYDIITNFGKRSMRTDTIVFPYWENAARLTEDYFALSTVLMLVFLTVPVCYALFLLVKYLKLGGSRASLWLKEKTVKLSEEMNDKLYEREQKIKKDEE